MVKTKTTTVTVTGMLERCEIRDEAEPDYNYTHRYALNTEHRAKYLDCALRTPEGDRFYFRTPRSNYQVSSCPGAAVITFTDTARDKTTGEYVFPADHPWFRMEGTIAVATPERSADKTLVAAVKTGDTITISGRIKQTATSRAGKPYTVLNHVRRVTPPQVS